MTSGGAAGVATALDGAEDVVDADAAGQRGGGGALDDRAVHQRVAVGHADLDDVAAGLDQHAHRLDRALDRSGSRPAGSRRARRGRSVAALRAQHRARRRAPWSATDGLRPRRRPNHVAAVSMSLSPRPDRLTSDSGVAGRARCPSSMAPGQRVRRLDGRDDALGAAEQAERLHGLVVGGVAVLGAADVAQPGVLGPDARVVEARGDRVRLDGLAVVVLQQVAHRAVQHAGRRRRANRRRVPAGLDALAAGLDADEAHAASSMKRWKMPIALEPPPTQAMTASGQPAGELEHLRAGLLADDLVEVADHLGERVRAGDGADQVVRRVDVGDPVAQRLVDGVLERARCRASTGTTSAPRSFIRATLSAWRSVSTSPM